MPARSTGPSLPKYGLCLCYCNGKHGPSLSPGGFLSAGFLMQVVYPRHEALTKSGWVSRAVAGIEALGHTASVSDTPEGADFVLCWGFRTQLARDARYAGVPVLALELGYYGNRKLNVSLQWNDLAGRGLRPAPMDAPRPKPVLRPWITRDTGPVLIFGQMPGDYAVRDIDVEAWQQEQVLAIGAAWSRPAQIRPHPGQHNNRPANTLEQDLDRAWLAVTYSSTAGVDAVCHGVPTVAMSEGSMARNVAGPFVSCRIMPDRDDWAHWLSYCQWNEQEVTDGTAMRHMLGAFEAARAAQKEGR